MKNEKFPMRCKLVGTFSILSQYLINLKIVKWTFHRYIIRIKPTSEYRRIYAKMVSKLGYGMLKPFKKKLNIIIVLNPRHCTDAGCGHEIQIVTWSPLQSG